jgi:hypothetical protein
MGDLYCSTGGAFMGVEYDKPFDMHSGDTPPHVVEINFGVLESLDFRNSAAYKFAQILDSNEFSQYGTFEAINRFQSDIRIAVTPAPTGKIGCPSVLHNTVFRTEVRFNPEKFKIHVTKDPTLLFEAALVEQITGVDQATSAEVLDAGELQEVKEACGKSPDLKKIMIQVAQIGESLKQFDELTAQPPVGKELLTQVMQLAIGSHPILREIRETFEHIPSGKIADFIQEIEACGASTHVD